MDPRRPEKVQKYKVPTQNQNAAPGEDLTPDYMNILDSSRKRSVSKCSERFKVVKIESTEPFKRGRWKCMDFLDQSYDRMAHYNSVMYKSSDTNLNQSISSNENWDNDNSSMLQIFQQQNIIMALDENKENISLKTENYACNEHGNYVLLPGMVSSSLVGIKYPFELNFLPISSSEHNLEGDSSESEIKSLHSQKSDYCLNQDITNTDLNLSLTEDQVGDIKVICQNDTKQIQNHNNLETKMSNGNIHYIPQNNEIQSTEQQINNNKNQSLTREVFNNCNKNNVTQNLNVINPNMNQVNNNNHNSIDPNAHNKEIIDNNFKQNIIPNPVNNNVYQQHIFTTEDYKNNQTNQNQEQFNHKKENYTNLNQSSANQNASVPEVKICNPNIQGYQSEQQNMQYNQGTNNVEVNPQLIKQPITNQPICPNNLSVRTHTYDVMPEIAQNQTVYTNSHFNKNNSGNHERSMHQENKNNQDNQINYTNKTYELHISSQQVCHNGNGSNNANKGHCETLQCLNNSYKRDSQNNNNGRFLVNEQQVYQKNSNSPENNFNFQKEEKICSNNANNSKEEMFFSRPMSAKCMQDDQKSKFSNHTSQHFPFIPEVNPEHSQTSLQNTNLNAPENNSHVFMDQTQLYMPVYPIGPSPYMQNMYFPVYSNTVQFPLLNQNSNNLCDNYGEGSLSRRPIAYQKIIIPQSINTNIKKTNQFYYQHNQTNNTKSTENFECNSPPNIENSPHLNSEVFNTNNSSLDVKIEALMDLVKKHVKFAIMEDIHSLKQKIILLKERVAQLEFENEMLKSNVEEFKKIKDKMG